MLTSTRPAVRATPPPRIPWARLTEEREVSDQVWSALPAEGAVLLDEVRAFLQREGLQFASPQQGVLYAYADGPHEQDSPVETEWYLEFRFVEDQLVELAVEKHLVGP